MSSMLNNPQVQNWINSLQLRVIDSGYARLGTEWKRCGVCSPYTRIYYILNGEGHAVHGGGKTVFREGRMYLIPIWFPFDYGCDRGIDQLYFHITMTQPDGADLFSQCRRIYEMPVEHREMERLVSLYQSPRMTDALYTVGCLYHDLVALITESGMENKPAYAYSEMLRTLFPLIHSRLSAKLTLRELAREMSCSLSTLTRRFHAEMEIPLGQYIDGMVFQKAQQLLLFTDLSVGEIADSLKFCDQFYFSRYFKSHQNETPSHYRKRLKAGN